MNIIGTIEDFRIALNNLDGSVKEKFSAITVAIPKIEDEYINFIGQKQASLADINCKLDDQENLIPELNDKILTYNAGIKREVQSKKQDLSQKIEISNINLGALKLIENQVESKQLTNSFR